MSRKRRGFLDREDALENASSEAPMLPESPRPPSKEPEVLSSDDFEFDLNLPESLEDPMPGFFGWDDDDELEGPPTEEVPNAPIDAWADEFSPPLSVPEAPPLEGIIDGYTPVLLAPKPEDSEGVEDSFDTFFDAGPPSKKKRKSSTVEPFKLFVLIALAVILGLGVGGVLAYLFFIYDAGNSTLEIGPPASILVKQEMRKGNSNTKAVESEGSDTRGEASQGTLRVIYMGKEDISVWVDGALFGGPPITTMLDGGEHSIRAVVKKNPKKRMDKTVTIEAGKTSKMNVIF